MPVATDPLPDVPAAASDTCALLARTHGAQLAGTAPVATGWVLVEQPGAWGRKALTGSALEPALGASLDDAAGDDVRVVLIRRPGSHAGGLAGPRTVLLAHVGPTPWIERVRVEGDAQLWELDPTVAAAPDPPGLGERVDGPVWLVCTHGKRDRCCAEHGRPIVDALAGDPDGADVWEVSHVGGHRFAGNLLSLPGGEVYGALDVSSARDVVTAQRAGRYDVARLRGRSGSSRPEQAAELLVRAHLGVDTIAAVTVHGSRPATDPAAGDAATEVALTLDGVEHRATVRAEPTGVAYLQSCDKDEPTDPGRFVLVELRRA